MKLCVFPNDPLQSYFDKGEIKERYYNPNNLFEEIHFISPIKKDIDPDKVSKIAGNARMTIHSIGNLNLINYKSKKEKISKIINNIRPDIIRSYNPLIQGWLATKIGNELSIPVIISIHNNYDKDVRELNKRKLNFGKFLKFKFSEKFLEEFSLSHASEIICAYRFLVPYARRHGGRRIQVIYNRVNLSQFTPAKKIQSNKPRKIIYVARLDPEKNHECLIRAIKNLDVRLVLIGRGNMKQKLVEITNELGIGDKVDFIDKIPNDELNAYYNSADIFAAPIQQGGVSIPMLEAMASGIPLIVSARKNGESEDIDDAVLFADNNPADFEKAILTLMNDEKLRDEMIRKGLEKIKLLDGRIMEAREEELYKKHLGVKQS